MQKWEYARILSDRGDVTLTYSHHEPSARKWQRVVEALRDLGDDGWELVTASNRDGLEVLHLKRALQP